MSQKVTRKTIGPRKHALDLTSGPANPQTKPEPEDLWPEQQKLIRECFAIIDLNEQTINQNKLLEKQDEFRTEVEKLKDLKLEHDRLQQQYVKDKKCVQNFQLLIKIYRVLEEILEFAKTISPLINEPLPLPNDLFDDERFKKFAGIVHSYEENPNLDKVRKFLESCKDLKSLNLENDSSNSQCNSISQLIKRTNAQCNETIARLQELTTKITESKKILSWLQKNNLTNSSN